MIPLPTSVISGSESPKFCPPEASTLGIFVRSLTWTRGKRPGYFLKYFKRILSAHFNPAKIHLHLYQLGIALFQKNVVGKFSIHRRELKPVIVIGKLDSGLLARFPSAIECFGGPLPAIRPLANVVVDVWIDKILVPNDVGCFQHARPGISQVLIRNVR